MRIIKTNILSLQQKKAIYILWNKEYPINLTYLAFEELENYLRNLKNQRHLLLIDENEIVKGWYFDFIRENEKWFAMILDSQIQGKGFGTHLLNEAKQSVTELNGWVIDHNNYKKTNINLRTPKTKISVFFYEFQSKVIQYRIVINCLNIILL